MRIVTFRIRDRIRGRLTPVDRERSRGGPRRPARRLGGALLVGAVVATAAGLSAGPVALAASSLPKECVEDGYTVTCTYGYTGAEQRFTVPEGVEQVQVTAIGAAGGGVLGGTAARVRTPLTVASGQSLYVEVGGVGGAPVAQKEYWDPSYYVWYYDGGVAGFNGGAPGGKAWPIYGGGKPSYAAAGSGGATDVRLASRGAGPENNDNLDFRQVVAGGGGGGINDSYDESGRAGGNADDGAFGGKYEPAGAGAAGTEGGMRGWCQHRTGFGNPPTGDVWAAPGEAGGKGAGGRGGQSLKGDVYRYTAPGGGGGGGLAGGGGGCGAAPGGGGSSLVPAGGQLDRSADPASVTITYQAPYRIEATSGGMQVAHLGQEFADPVVATVRNPDGTPRGEKVRFTIMTPNATFAGDEAKGEVDVGADADSGRATSPKISTSADPAQASEVKVMATVVRDGDTDRRALFTMTLAAPDKVEATSGGGQSAQTGADFATPLVATVRDRFGAAYEDVPVTFTVTGPASFPGGTASASVETDEDGEATAPTLTAGAAGAKVTVTASTPGVAAGAVFDETVTALPTPGAIAATSGDGQRVETGTPFPTPLVATVTDTSGAPFVGAPVTFTVAGPATFPGNATVATVPTGADGTAQAPALTAGNAAGTVTVRGSTPRVTATANWTGTVLARKPVPGKIVATSGGAQQAETGKPFALPLVATVTDTTGAPLQNAPVTFTVTGTTTGPASFPGGAAIAMVTTGADGRATAPTLTAGPKAGPVTVRAATPGVTAPAQWAATVIDRVGAPARILATGGGGQSAMTGSAFAAPMVATVTDAAGRPVPGAPVTFSSTGPASFAAPGGGGRTTAVTVTGGADGRAVAPTLTAGADPGAVTVRATTPAVRGGATFTQTVSAAADLGVTLVAPKTIAAGSAFTATLTVTNTGPSRAIGVTGVVALPTGMTVLSAAGGSVSASRTMVTYSRPVLAPGESATYTVVLTSTRTLRGVQTLRAGAHSERTPDPDGADNTAASRITLTG